MIYLLISLRLALPGSTTDPRQKRGRALSPEAHHRRPFFFFFSLFSHTFLFLFLFLGMGGIGVGQGKSKHCLILVGWLPHGNVIKPLPSPSTRLFMYFLGWSGGYGYQNLSWPGPQGPQPVGDSVGSRSQRFCWVVCFQEIPCSSPVRGSGISQEIGEVVASCWGFASPWPPSPFPDYFP